MRKLSWAVLLLVGCGSHRLSLSEAAAITRAANAEQHVAMASDPSTDSNILLFLTERTTDANVWMMVANHPNTNEMTQRNLLGKKDCAVTHAIRHRRNLSDSIRSQAIENMVWLAEDESSTQKCIEALARSRDVEVRLAVANRKSLSSETEALLARDYAWAIRKIIANRTSDSNILRQLATDVEREVRDAVASNPILSQPKVLRVPIVGYVPPE